MKTILIECPSCGGTGLYKGMAERGGAAVVCYKCRGTGHTTYSYNDFTGRNIRQDVNRVYEGSFGYAICDIDITTKDGDEINFSQYGCTYEEWLSGAEPIHIKDLYCPYLIHPACGEEPLESCKIGIDGLGSRISSCKYYGDKKTCWELFDRLNAEAKG